MKLKKMLTLALGLVLSFPLFAKQYPINDFGAVADSSVLSTQAIQAAIDACSTNGGGQVVIPAGCYKTGSLILKNNVELRIESGAVLLGSRDLNDYIKLQPVFVSLRTQTPTIQLIYAENAENISITGGGTIDGQGSNFKKLTWDDEGITRPHLLRFITCNNIVVKDVTLKNSGCWMQHYLACENLQITGVRIFNRNNYNNDALDIDGCCNVTVSGLIADSDDDGITLKSTSPKSCENISITNCVISSRCNAIKLGTETNGGFRNIQISACVIKPSKLTVPSFFGRERGTSAIALEIVDGGTMENISVSNMVVDGTESPIFIRLGNRARTYRKGVVINKVGVITAVSISNIRIKNAGKTGCSITGLPDHPVDDIRLSNIVMEQAGGGTIEDINALIEEKPAEYPEATMFGILPAYGFYIRHATNVIFDGAQFAATAEDARPAFYMDDVKGSVLTHLQFQGNKETKTAVQLKNSKDIIIKESWIKSRKESGFIKLENDAIATN
ncbi:Exo-poly-alpha-D-galacturonosidase [termite gut metagenome]|uniref:Exo-poly-alpha-D-galacturonosidase n=1 Tax=termite gut metagenome TaxID=433724 RepID=A0A5J4SSA6_9ZZZZ